MDMHGLGEGRARGDARCWRESLQKCRDATCPNIVAPNIGGAVLATSSSQRDCFVRRGLSATALRMDVYGGSPRRRMDSPADCRAPWELTSPAHACLTSPRESPNSGGMLC